MYSQDPISLIYESSILLDEGVMKPKPHEQEAYDRLVKINNNAGTRDFTDALLQWYRTSIKKSNKDISFDQSNHIRDTLKILNKYLSNGKIQPNTIIEIESPRGTIKKDIANPKEFFDFEVFNKNFTEYLNSLEAQASDEYDSDVFEDANIELYMETDDFVVFRTRTYDSTLKFIRLLWEKMRGTSNLGAYGIDAYDNNLCPYCTSGKSHWDSYASSPNYIQYWILENIGTDLKNYYNKGKDVLYAMVDSDGDLLNNHDEKFDEYTLHANDFYDIIETIEVEHDLDLRLKTQEEIQAEMDEYINYIRSDTSEDGVYNGSIIIVPKFITDLKIYSFIKKVTGDFICHYTQLTSLEGAPQEVSRDFDCLGNPKLTNLKGAPEKVGRSFVCNYNPNLTSLEGAPQEVDGDFNCGYMKI